MSYRRKTTGVSDNGKHREAREQDSAHVDGRLTRWLIGPRSKTLPAATSIVESVAVI